MGCQRNPRFVIQPGGWGDWEILDTILSRTCDEFDTEDEARVVARLLNAQPARERDYYWETTELWDDWDDDEEDM